jgi:hypothetical protein
MRKNYWLITQAQIRAGDIGSAIQSVDPEQISDDTVFGLHGAVRLRIEGAAGMADVIADPATRRYFRALHQRWPWAAFFLRLHPLGAQSPAEEIVDLSVFLSLILVHVDDLTLAETPRGVCLRYNADQFRRQLADLQNRAAQLAEAVDLPRTRISQRDALIARAVTSFFEAGQALNP